MRVVHRCPRLDVEFELLLDDPSSPPHVLVNARSIALWRFVLEHADRHDLPLTLDARAGAGGASRRT